MISTIALTSDAGADRTYGIGDEMQVTVTFDKAVDIAGMPTVQLEIGAQPRLADCMSGTNTTTMVCTYEVALNDTTVSTVGTVTTNDGPQFAPNSVKLNGGTIKNAGSTTVDANIGHLRINTNDNHLVDGILPTLVTTGEFAPKTSLDGSRIILFFSEPIGTVDRPKITVKSGSTTKTTSGYTHGGTKVEITLTTALLGTDTNVTVELAADAVKDVPGNGIAVVAATSVFRANAPGAPVLAAAAKDESIELTWTIADNGSSDITRFEYRIKETTGGTYPATWTDTGAAASNTGGSATIGSLTNTTQYTVQVRGVNSEGEGAVSNEPTATPDAPPEVDSVAITSTPANAGTYVIDDDIEFTLTFDKPLTLGGTNLNHRSDPYITYRMESHTDDPQKDDPEASCVIGTDTKTLVCTDDVNEGNYDTDGIHLPAGQLQFLNPAVKGFYGPLGQLISRAHSAIAASANHKVDGVKPTLSSANALGDLTKVVLTFREAIGTVDNTKITVKKGGTTQSTTGAAIATDDATKVEIALTTALAATDTNVTVDLAADAVKDVPGNGNAEDLATAVSLVDTVAPTFVSAGTNDTDEVVLTYSEALNTTQPATSAFTVEVGGVGRGVDTVAISGQAPSRSRSPRPSAPATPWTVAYTKPGTNPIKDAADNEAVSLPETTVTNNLAATAPDAPPSLGAGTYTISTAPTRIAADRLELSWVIPWNNGSLIEKFQYRYAEGSSVPPSTAWVDIPNSAPGDPNDTDFSVTGLDADTEYTFEVRAVNGIEPGPAAAVTWMTPTPDWSFRLTGSSGNNVTQFTEGGDSATATVSIANNVRFSTAQTVTLKHGTLSLNLGLIRGAGGATTITIPANGDSGSLVISAPDNVEGTVLHTPPFTRALTATHGGTQIGGSIDLAFVDDESVPVVAISMAPTTVDEGGNIEVDFSLTPPTQSGWVNFTVTDADGALSGTPPTAWSFTAGQTTVTVTLTAADNSVQNDGAREVTVTLGAGPEITPYTLGTPSSVTVTVRDNDTPPTAPENLTAQAGDTEATLSWQAPLPSTPDHEQPVLHYEYIVKVGNGSFGFWTRFPNSDASTRSHTFTGLPNDTLHTYQVRAVNVAGGGASLQTSVTPIEGVAVSFGAATLSVDEGESVAVTVTLAEAPAAGTTVTVPIVATPGAGLEAGEYSGVPTSVTFNAGETSKSFTVTTVEDTADEPNAALTLAFGTLPAGYIVGANVELVLTVVDDDHPIVSATFGAAAASVVEGGSVEVTVSLSPGARARGGAAAHGDAGCEPRRARVCGCAGQRDRRGRRDAGALHGDVRGRRGGGGQRDAGARLRDAADRGDAGREPAAGADAHGRRRPACGDGPDGVGG